MVKMHFRLHFANVKSRFKDELLYVSQNSLRPLQYGVVCNHYQAFSRIANRLHTAFSEYLYTFAGVAGAPGRVGIERVVSGTLRKHVNAVIFNSAEVL